MRLAASSNLAVAGALAAAAGLGGCMKTASYGTGESPEVAILREVTGGLVGGKKEQVAYQPRAPLVLPPSAAGGQLPAPAPDAEVAVAQWPNDPDQGTQDESARYAEDDGSGLQEDYRRLKPLGQFARPGRSMRERTAREDAAMDLVRGKQQRETFRAALNDANGIRQERRYLTDPPEEVREPAATAPQEFDEIEKKKKGNFLTRMFTRG